MVLKIIADPMGLKRCQLLPGHQNTQQDNNHHNKCKTIQCRAKTKCKVYRYTEIITAYYDHFLSSYIVASLILLYKLLPY